MYERGLAAFCWPHLNDLWLMYLTKFVSRYKSRKLERARELFQQATSGVPARYAKRLFLLYARLEEEFGLAKHALTIYHAATRAVLESEKLDMYYVYIARVGVLPSTERKGGREWGQIAVRQTTRPFLFSSSDYLLLFSSPSFLSASPLFLERLFFFFFSVQRVPSSPCEDACTS